MRNSEPVGTDANQQTRKSAPKRVGFQLNQDHHKSELGDRQDPTPYGGVDVTHPSSLRKTIDSTAAQVNSVGRPSNLTDETRQSAMGMRQFAFRESQVPDGDPPYENYDHTQEPHEFTAYKEQLRGATATSSNQQYDGIRPGRDTYGRIASPTAVFEDVNNQR